MSRAGESQPAPIVALIAKSHSSELAGLAISGFAQWIANFAITMTFPIMLATAGIGLAGAYGFYAVCALISVFFVFKAVRETKGLELEEMQG